MYISKLVLTNFRKYKSLSIEFNPNLNVLVGENNSGKTAIIDAIRIILADYWMRRICNMSKSKITKYVNNYKKGMLDPYQYEPKERNIANENGFMSEEDEDDFIGGI